MSNLQISSFTTHDLEVVAVYRSANCQNATDVILPFITQEKNIIICEDLNICYNVNRQHPLILWLLQQGFQQIIDGGWIDHFYYRKGAANLVLDI